MRTRKIARYGWRPDLPDARDYLLDAPPSGPLPASVDLRNKCPPVYDQGQTGSCCGNSAAGAVQFERMKQGLAPDFVPSRLFLYWNARAAEDDTDQDGGAQIRDVIKGAATFGAPSESDWPFDPDKVTVKPDEAAFTDGKFDLALKYQRLIPGAGRLKACLAAGSPFVFGFSVYDSFESDEVAKTGVVPMPGADEELQGGHAVMAVGYDDPSKRFLVRNSWGAGWGMAGYFTLPYAYLLNSNLASDFWTISLVGGVQS